MRARLALGSILLIIGFLTYQTGISIIRDQNTLATPYINKIISYLTISQNVFYELLVYFGGIVVIIGFLISVSTMSTPKVIHVEKTIKPGSKPTPQKVSDVPSCKFCGASITEDDIFCPECNKALK